MFDSGRARLKRILAIDWDERTLRVVHALSNKRGAKVDRILSVGLGTDVDPESPEAMGAHIKRVLDQESIKTRHAMVDIPREQAILKTLKLPAIKAEELAGVVEIQIAKELPFPVSQAAIDFTFGAEHDGGKTRDVLVSAVRHEVVEQYQATFAAAGLKLVRIGLRPYASKVALCKLLEFSMPSRVMFIDVRPGLTEIDVLSEGSLTFSRAASVPIAVDIAMSPSISINREESGIAEEPAPHEDSGVEPSITLTLPSDGSGGVPSFRKSPLDEAIQALVIEVSRSIKAYRAGDPGAQIDQVIVGGDTGVEARLAEVIQERLGLETELYNPAAAFGWEPDEGVAAAGFAPTLGLVLDYADEASLHFDFLHPKKTVSVAEVRLKKAPWVAAIAVLFLVATSMGVVGLTKDDRETLASIEAEIAELKTHRSDNKKFLALMRDLREFDQNQHIWIDEWYDVFSLLPDNQEMVVNNLAMIQKDGLIKLKTKAKEGDTAGKLIENLEAFRREGRDRPRYRVTMGPQSEKKGDRYPFVQELRIRILDDTPGKKRAAKKKRRSRN